MTAWLSDCANFLAALARRRSGMLGWLAAISVAAIALMLRLPAFDGRPLWTDELWRATLILDPGFWHAYLFAPTVETAITSPVYAVLVKSVAAFWVSPDTLRLSSLIPGVLAAPIAFAVVRKSGGGIALSLLAGLLLAVNRSFAGYSNELKPYMLEVCMHLVCMYAWISLLASGRPTRRLWFIYFLTLTLAVLSAANAVFLLPASGISLFFHFLIKKDVKGLAVCVAGFASLGTIVLALYYFAWRHGASADMLAIWADGFRGINESYIRFLVLQFTGLWTAAFYNIPGLALALLLGSVGWLITTHAIKREPVRNYLLFYFVLIVTLCVLNAIRTWPLGAGRENLFLYAHAVIFVFLLAAQVPYARMLARIGLAFGAVALSCGALFLVWQAQTAQPGQSLYHRLMARLQSAGAPLERNDLVMESLSARGSLGKAILAECSKRKTTVVADGYMAKAVTYYVQYDSAHNGIPAPISGGCVRYITYTEAYLFPAQTEALFSSTLRDDQHAWFIYSFLDDPQLAALKHIAARFGQITVSKDYGGAGYFELAPAKPQDGQ